MKEPLYDKLKPELDYWYQKNIVEIKDEDFLPENNFNKDGNLIWKPIKY